MTVLFLFLVSLSGCKTTPSLEDDHTGWRGLPRDYAIEWLSDYPNVLLVCITSDHISYDPDYHGSIWWLSGTVARVYRGDWRMGEKITFAHGLDYTTPCVSNLNVGALMFVFTDVHTNEPFAVDTGDFERYSEQAENLFQSLNLLKREDRQ